MESEKLDRLVRGVAQGATRRGMMRLGLGALAALAMAMLGPRAEDAGAKKKRRRICDCSSMDPASCINRRMRRNRANRILRNNACAYRGRCQPGVSGCPQECIAPRPVACGAGCCPEQFSKCCQDVTNPVITSTCAPTSAVCCPVSAGGFSCPAEAPQCCPITKQDPRGGVCATAEEACCTSDQGGDVCPAGTVCCTVTDEYPDGRCCPSAEDCCNDSDDCDEGGECIDGCCDAEVNGEPRAASNRKRRGTKRVGIAAR